MIDPKPINLTNDAYWRELGWPAVARDSDGHVISTCANDDDATFNEWLRECFEGGLTVINLTKRERQP